MNINKTTFKNSDNIDIEFSLIQRGRDVGIMMHCVGDYGFGTKGNNNGNYIGAMTMAALHRWVCRFYVFDFSKLKYEWSDSLTGIAHAIKKLRSPNYEVYFITSELSHKGVLSLKSYAERIFTPTIITDVSQIWSAQQGDPPEPVTDL